MITIEVAFATPKKQKIIKLTVEENIAVLEAIKLSNIAKYFPDQGLDHIDPKAAIGIFGKKIDISVYKLQDKDRIELYRSLNKTPNQKRLERAKTKTKYMRLEQMSHNK